MVLRLFCNWIKTVNNWDQWPKLEKSTPHREAKKKFNRKQMKRAGIVNKSRFTWCVEKYRCEHCYVTTCNSIYNSFQITAEMRSNSDLMNRYHSQQTSIASYRRKQMELCVYELKKKRASIAQNRFTINSILFIFRVFAIWWRAVCAMCKSNRIPLSNNVRC